MWSYEYRYLSHSFKEKEWDKHKYIDKIKIKNGKYRYIYDEPKNTKKSKDVNIGTDILLGTKVIPTLRASGGNKVSNFFGIYKIDIKAKEKISNAKGMMRAEDIMGAEDSYDDVYSTTEILKYFKKELEDIYDQLFLKYYGKHITHSYFEYLYENDLKDMREALTEYYGVLPGEFYNYNKYDEAGIVCLYFISSMIDNGYDPNKVSLSHYMQNLGLIDPEDIYKDNATTVNGTLKKKSKTYKNDYDMEAVNDQNLKEMALSNYNTTYPKEAGVGYTSNCAYCTLAYELRRRGYDVEASSVSLITCNSQAEIESWYSKNGKDCAFTVFAANSKSDMQSAIEKNLLKDLDPSNNARGQFIMEWKDPSTGQPIGGHSIVYEVVNGEIVLRDCQINKKYTVEEFLDENYYMIYDLGFLRTDDKDINRKALTGVRNRR